MYLIIKDGGQIDKFIFVSYMGIWSGAKVVEKAIDAYAATKGAPIGDRTSVVTTPDLPPPEKDK